MRGILLINRRVVHPIIHVDADRCRFMRTRWGRRGDGGMLGLFIRGALVSTNNGCNKRLLAFPGLRGKGSAGSRRVGVHLKSLLAQVLPSVLTTGVSNITAFLQEPVPFHPPVVLDVVGKTARQGGMSCLPLPCGQRGPMPRSTDENSDRGCGPQSHHRLLRAVAALATV